MCLYFCITVVCFILISNQCGCTFVASE